MDQNTNIISIDDLTPEDNTSQGLVSVPGDSLSRAQHVTPGDTMSQERQATAATSSNVAQEGRKKSSLTGAAKRRLKKLLAQGVEYARARELCIQPTVPPSQGSNVDPTRLDKGAGNKRGHKRNRSEECSPKENPRKSTKLETARPTYKEVTSAIKIGIKAEDRHMSEAELSLVQASIIGRIGEEAPGGGSGPRFIACSRRDGWLCITCMNVRSRDWLVERISTLKPWEDAKLAIMLEKDFPRPYIGVIWVPGPLEDPKLVLHRITYQNDHMNCARWRLLNCTPGEKGQHITFSMAQSSFDELQRNGLAVSFGFGHMAVRIKAPRAQASEVAPLNLVEREEPTGPKTAEPEAQQSVTPAARPMVVSTANSFRGGNADIFDPQQPGPSGRTQVLARDPAGASSTAGTAQVLARDPTSVSRTQRGQKGISGAILGPANSTTATMGRTGVSRAPSAHQQTMPSQLQRGAARRGRGRGTFKVPSARKPTLKGPAPKKP